MFVCFVHAPVYQISYIRCKGESVTC